MYDHPSLFSIFGNTKSSCLYLAQQLYELGVKLIPVLRQSLTVFLGLFIIVLWGTFGEKALAIAPVALD